MADATKTKTPYADQTMHLPRLTDKFSPPNRSGYTKLSEVEGIDLDLMDIEYKEDGKFGPCTILTVLDRTQGDPQELKLITSSQTLVPLFLDVMEEIEQGELALPFLVRFVKRHNPNTDRDFWAVE